MGEQYRCVSQYELELLYEDFRDKMQAVAKMQDRLLRGCSQEPGRYSLNPNWLCTVPPVIARYTDDFEFVDEVALLRRLFIDNQIDRYSPNLRRIRCAVWREHFEKVCNELRRRLNEASRSSLSTGESTANEITLEYVTCALLLTRAWGAYLAFRFHLPRMMIAWCLDSLPELHRRFVKAEVLPMPVRDRA